MPVINLPKDTRWGDLGASLGGGIAQALEAYNKKQAEQGVAAIMQDPSIAEDKRLAEAYKKFGKTGADIYKEFVTTEVLSSLGAQRKASAAKDASAVARQDAYIRALTGGGVSGGATTSSAPAPTTTPVTAPAATPSASARPPAGAVSGGGTIGAVGEGASAQLVDMLSGAPVGAQKAQAAAPAASAATTSPTSGTGNLIEQTVDSAIRASGITITPEERSVLVQKELANILRPTGGKELGSPTEDFIKLKQAGAEFPGKMEKQQMDLAAQRSVLPTVGPMARNAATQSDLETAAKQQVAPTVGPRAEVELQSSKNAAAATTPTLTTPEDVAGAYASFTPEQTQAVAQAARTGGPKAALDLTQSFVTANTTAARSVDAERVKRVADVENRTRTFTQVMDDIETNPQLQGGVEGIVNPILARYGYDFGQIPPAAYGEIATSSQLALQALQGHRGFGGAYLVKAVAETMPTAAKQKLFKAIESNFQAQQDVIELESLRRAAQDKGQNTGQIDAAIDKARKLEERTGTLWWTADKRVFYKGREINPDSWLPIEGGARELASKDFYKIGNRSYTGTDINTIAREIGVTPEEAYARLRGQATGQMPARGGAR